MGKHRGKQLVLDAHEPSAALVTKGRSMGARVLQLKQVVPFVVLLLLGGLLPFWRLAPIVMYGDQECFVEMPYEASKAFREMSNCIMCTKVADVPKISNVQSEEFQRVYIDRTKPVVVTDGMAHWTATQKFTFEFFKQVYNKHPTDGCQFFPYRTEFKSLQEALNMSQERANLEKDSDPWYIGWSNCHDSAGRELRKHYERPYFLPLMSENIALSWIFMGGPGHGAHIHVDNVRYASWQAQLRGRKRWRLVPPPECAFQCSEVDVIVEPGEIIVVDTNVWYHQTFVLDGNISITIGSEFD